MKNRKVENKRLEELEKQLFAATQITDGELEKIVSGANLFDSVMTRIESADEQQRPPEPERSSLFGFDRLPGFLTLRRGALVGAFGILILLLANFVRLNPENSKTIAGDKNDTDISQQQDLTQKTIAKVENKGDLVTDPGKPTGKALTPGDETAAVRHLEFKTGKTKTSDLIRKAGFEKKQKRSGDRKIRKRGRKKSATNKRAKPKVKREEEQKVFYQLPFIQNGETPVESLEVVSAELSRAELFALGVNLQLENTVSTIKAELLVGTDGIARAIRVVEKF